MANKFTDMKNLFPSDGSSATPSATTQSVSTVEPTSPATGQT